MLGFGSIGEFATGEYADSLGIDISIPLQSQAITIHAPILSNGASIGVPTLSLSSIPQAPALRNGSAIFIPTNLVSNFTPLAPRISISATIHPPTSSISFELYLPIIVAGQGIIWRSEELVQSYIGGIGEGSIGEYSLGEGEPSLVAIVKIPTLSTVIFSPRIAAGKTILPPVMNIASVPYAIEIGARRRKLRSWAISS